MDIETILQIASLNKVIFYFMIGVFLLVFVVWLSSKQYNKPLEKKKGRVLLTILALILSPLFGTLISIPIRSSLELHPQGFYPGFALIGGKLSIITFVIITCFVWFSKRESRT